MSMLKVVCPTCKNKFSYYTSDFRPFCSDRCRMIDLGHWLSESYTVPAVKLTEEETQTLEQLINEEESEEKDEGNFN